MNIVFAASESVPFIKTGGLGDVIGSLPQAIKQQGDHQIHVFLPNYKNIPESFIQKMETIYTCYIPLGWRKQYCGVKHLVHQGVHFYFIDNEYYFGREQIYGYADDFDEAERFIFFSKAILEVLPAIQLQPDILHVHDWQTATIPILLHTTYKQSAFYQHVKTVFTIHNLKYQGVFPNEIVGDLLEIEQEYVHAESLEFYGRVNLMKGAILYADVVTTVSDEYAKEIQYPFYGEGLDGILQKRNKDLYGIINGINRTNIPFTLAQKSEWKKGLQKELGIGNTLTPVIAMITRLVEQKGLDLVLHVMDELLAEDIQLIVLGTGEAKYERLFSHYAEKYPSKFHFLRLFDEALSHRIYKGADLFLMPSLFEPCGLSQLISLSYGTIPIVRETGGLKDTIVPYNEFTKEGNGFSFSNYNAHDMLFTIKRAIHFYWQESTWVTLIKHAVESDFSWTQSSKKYQKLYESLTKNQRTVTD